MAAEKRVRVEFLRAYPPWVTDASQVGSVREVPASAVPRMLAGSPPFARIAEVVGDAAAAVDATDGARALAAEEGVDLRPYAGQGSGPGGRIWKEDVERWAAA